MADYRLPMDADGVKYHGTVDQNEENPGQFMYGLDENGNKRIIRTDEQGNVLTRVTGSIVELIAEVNDAFVPAGTKVKVIDKVDTSDFLYIFVQVRPRGLRDYTVSYRPFMGNENVEITEFTFLDITGDRGNKVSDNRRPFGLNVSLYVENKTQEDNEIFEVYLFGVRR